MKNTILYVIIATLVVLVVAYIYTNIYAESFVDYTQEPYGYMKSGSEPLYFYRKDRYRRPYNDGFRFYKSYPYPHMEMMS
jgi:hypothetical protein